MVHPPTHRNHARSLCHEASRPTARFSHCQHEGLCGFGRVRIDVAVPDGAGDPDANNEHEDAAGQEDVTHVEAGGDARSTERADESAE